MKNLLISFFEPLNKFLFSYLSKKGFIKFQTSTGSQLGAAAVQAGAGLISARNQRKAAKTARNIQLKLQREAMEQLRDPGQILADAYGSTGMFGIGPMGSILEREAELIPEFQRLKETRLGEVLPTFTGVSDEARLRQLDQLGLLSPRIRETLEDPRLGQIADLQLQRSQEMLGLDPSVAEMQLLGVGQSLADLSPTDQEALLQQRGMELAASTGELDPREAIEAQQAARAASVARGRALDPSSIYGELESRISAQLNKRDRDLAQGASLLGTADAIRRARIQQGTGALTTGAQLGAFRRGEGSQALQSALQGASTASVNPYAFMTAVTPEQQLANRLLTGTLGTEVTDPGQAISVGSARDAALGNLKLGQGATQAQFQSAKGQIGADLTSNLVSALSQAAPAIGSNIYSSIFPNNKNVGTLTGSMTGMGGRT